MPEHYTSAADEGRLVRDGADAVSEARKLHPLATADPGMDRQGMPTGPLHEKMLGLERHDASVAAWESVGVHPYENRALGEGEPGAGNLRGDASGEKGEGKVAPTSVSASPTKK